MELQSMDPPPPQPSLTTAPATASSHSDPFPLQNNKLRLMCSYGGHIVPRHNSKNLCYIGGDTRIVAVDRRTTATSLSSFTTHLSSTLLLRHHRPFIVKFQLPHHDLDALISLTADDDLHLMIDEYDRLSSVSSSRLRLFLFPFKPTDHVETRLHDSPFDSWFVDSLKSTKIMRKKERSDDSGSDSASVEAPSEGLNGSGNGGGDVKCGGELCSVPETIVLETTSSFGSASSSVSLSNLPPIKVHPEDGGVNFPDNKVKLLSPDSAVSDNSIASAISHPQSVIYQDAILPVASTPVESESNVSSPNSGTQIHETVQVSGYQISPQLGQSEQQQALQFVPAGAHYIPHYTTGTLPVSSYYANPMYHPQQNTHYQPNQPYPVYLLPVGHTQSYNLPVQYNLIDAGSVASSRHQMHSTAAMIPSQMIYKEVSAAPPSPESAMKVYRTAPATTQLIHVPSYQNQKQLMDLPQMHHVSQSVAISSMDTANYCNEVDDDPAHAQIYKSQPPAPSLTSQYQTMTKATTLLLSEGLTKLHGDEA